MKIWTAAYGIWTMSHVPVVEPVAWQAPSLETDARSNFRHFALRPSGAWLHITSLRHVLQFDKAMVSSLSRHGAGNGVIRRLDYHSRVMFGFDDGKAT